MKPINKVIETENLSLEDWLKLIHNPPEDTLFAYWEFPSEQHFQDYICSIGEREESEVTLLLRKFLVPTGTFGQDKSILRFITGKSQSDPERFEQLLNSEFNKRLMAFGTGKSKIPPWEGITWVLDLLPHFPRQAIEAIDAYFLAHIQQLPDGRSAGLPQAMALIRAKFIGFPRTPAEAINFLFEIHHRDFEHLIERLYNEIGYETELTPPKKDGGKDIVTKNIRPGKLEHARIECKRYRGPVGVEIARSLLGVVSDEKVNKGVIVTTSRFTKGAKELAKRNPRLELIDGEHLIPLLNEYFGAHWPLNLESIIADSQKRHTKSN